MKKAKLTRKLKVARNKAGTQSVNSKYAKKHNLQKKGIFSPRSPFYRGAK